MLFISAVALLSPAWAMRNLASHETALGIEDQDKNDSFSFDELWNAPAKNRSIYHGQEPDPAVYYWFGDDLCKRNTTLVVQEKVWSKLIKVMMHWMAENVQRAKEPGQ